MKYYDGQDKEEIKTLKWTTSSQLDAKETSQMQLMYCSINKSMSEQT